MVDQRRLLDELREDMRDPEFAAQYEEAARKIREELRAKKDALRKKDPEKFYEGTADLHEVPNWDEELDEWADQLVEEASLSTDPLLRELLFRRAWLLRGAAELAWHYLDLN